MLAASPPSHVGGIFASDEHHRLVSHLVYTLWSSVEFVTAAVLNTWQVIVRSQRHKICVRLLESDLIRHQAACDACSLKVVHCACHSTIMNKLAWSPVSVSVTTSVVATVIKEREGRLLHILVQIFAPQPLLKS